MSNVSDKMSLLLLLICQSLLVISVVGGKCMIELTVQFAISTDTLEIVD